jgi:hypothetical protein
MEDIVTYLNRSDVSPFYSKLVQSLRDSKQGRASVAQWSAMIQALTQKGVKALEIEESGVSDWLATRSVTEVLTKDELLHEIARRYYTVKEVRLGSPRFVNHRQPGGEYQEWLYIANSECANVEDAIEQIEFEMSGLIFEMDKIMADPDLPVRLAAERAKLMAQRGTAIEFPNHHFSDQVNGKHGKNLIAHCRVTRRDDVYFIEEIQSDWAQRGRKDKWRSYPKGPLVTSTDAWAGMVLRRHLQIAAQDPRVKQVAWITESMRNGMQQDLQREQRKVEQKKAYSEFVAQRLTQKMQGIELLDLQGEALDRAKEDAKTQAQNEAHEQGLSLPSDLLNDFYLEVVPKLVNKLLGKSGAKVGFADIAIGGRPVKVPAFEMTDAARQLLVASQPLYSRAPLVPFKRTLSELEPQIEAAIAATSQMLGSAHSVRLATHLYDLATGREVAGRYGRGFIEISLQAADIEEVAAHEAFHFAWHHLLTRQEIGVLRESFAPGTALNRRTRLLLRSHGMHEAADQCDDPEEAAAHAFTLWRQGRMGLRPEGEDGAVAKLFTALKTALVCSAQWVRSVWVDMAGPEGLPVKEAGGVDRIFSELREGVLARDCSRWSDASTSRRDWAPVA